MPLLSSSFFIYRGHPRQYCSLLVLWRNYLGWSTQIYYANRTTPAIKADHQINCWEEGSLLFNSLFTQVYMFYIHLPFYILYFITILSSSYLKGMSIMFCYCPLFLQKFCFLSLFCLYFYTRFVRH